VTFNPTDRVVLSAVGRRTITETYGAPPEALDTIGVVVTNPYARHLPPELLQLAVDALGHGEVFVRWSLDPDTACPMANDEVELWAPSYARHPNGEYAIGDTVMTRACYCECARCDFTVGRVLAFDPPGVTRGGTVGHPYMVQWDDGWITYDDEAELCFVGDRHNPKEEYI